MEFNFTRFMHLIRRELLVHQRILSIGALGLVVLVSVLTLIAHAESPGHALSNPDSKNAWLLWFLGSLVLGGGLLTTAKLGDLRSASSRLQYLHLPASTLEKLLSKWLFSLPLFLLFISLVFGGILGLYSILYEAPNPVQLRLAGYFMCLYIVGHAIAFFCACVFNRHAALKGGFSFGLLFLGLGFIAGIGKLVLTDFQGNLLDAWGTQLWEMMVVIGDNPFWLLLLAPLLWVASYVVLKNKQA